MGSVATHFEPGPNGTIRFRTRYGDSDSGMVGHSDELVEPQADILGIPWAEFIAAGTGTIDRPEDGPAVIRRDDDQSETETGSCPSPVPSWTPRSTT